MTERDFWVPWRIEFRETANEDQKPTKVPVNPHTGKRTDVTASEAGWSFDEVWAYYNDSATKAAGIGYVFTQEGPFTGIDLDDCRDPETGIIDAWARDVINRLASYTYISTLGTGIHVIVIGDKPGNKCRTDCIEMYDHNRFFAVTGVQLSPDSTND